MLFASFKKKKLAEKTAFAMQKSIGADIYLTADPSRLFNANKKLEEERKAAFGELFRCMSAVKKDAALLAEKQTSAEELYQMAVRCVEAGLGLRGTRYLPVALLTATESLSCMLEHRQELLHGDLDAVRAVAAEAEKLLPA